MAPADLEREQEDAAAADAAAIGGRVSDEDDVSVDEASRPLVEAGEGESEGFELAEEELVENASHGDQHAARRVIEDAPHSSDDARSTPGGEADGEHSSELDDDTA
jgi:hypothetical protein